MKGKNCLVTGGSGFVGSHLVKRLVDMGSNVTIIDIEEPDSSIKNDVEFFNIDIRNPEKLNNVCKGIDHVFHTVSLVPISKADKQFESVNAGGTKNIVEASKNQNVESVVHLSSTSVYKIPERGDIIDENYPLEPVASYGRSKFLAEKICLEYMKKDVPISIIRPKTILGPNRLGIYSILFDWIKNNKPIFIFGDGQNKYSYIGITDLIDATILSATKGKGEIFNIATDKYGTYKGDIENLIQYAKSGSKTHCVNATVSRQIMKLLDKLNLSPFSEWHYSIIDKEYVFDISKAKKILGWSPKESNTQLFQESYDWFVENSEKLKITGTTHTTKLNPKIFKLIDKL